MTVPLRAALYLRVSTARQAEHDVSIPDQKRQGEAYCQSRGYQLVETYVEPGASATNDRRPEFQRMIEAGTSEARAVRCGGRPFVQPLLPRSFRTGILRPQAREERRQAGLDHPGNGRRSHARHDAADHGAVRRIPVERERQACPPRLEGERAARILERLAAADRLPRRRGRAARREGQEEAGDRPAARRHGAADLSPCPGRRRHVRADGRQEHHGAPQPAANLHPRRRALGHRAGSPHPDPRDLYRPPRVQQAQQIQGTEAGQRGDRRRGAAADRPGHLRRRAGASACPQPQGHARPRRQRPHAPYRHLLLRRLRRAR